MEWVWLCVVNCSKIEILIKIDEQNTLHYQFFLSKMSQFTPFSRVNWKIWYSCLCKTFDKFHVCVFVFVFVLSTCLMEGGQGSANSYPGSSITCSCQKCFNCKEIAISTFVIPGVTSSTNSFLSKPRTLRWRWKLCVLVTIAHISHYRRYRRRYCTFFKPVYFSA